MTAPPVFGRCWSCAAKVDTRLGHYCHECRVKRFGPAGDTTRHAQRVTPDGEAPPTVVAFGDDDPMLPATRDRDTMTWRVTLALALLVAAIGVPWWIGVVRIVCWIF